MKLTQTHNNKFFFFLSKLIAKHVGSFKGEGILGGPAFKF